MKDQMLKMYRLKIMIKAKLSITMKMENLSGKLKAVTNQKNPQMTMKTTLKKLNSFLRMIPYGQKRTSNKTIKKFNPRTLK